MLIVSDDKNYFADMISLEPQNDTFSNQVTQSAT